MFLLYKHICVPLAKNFVARYQVSKVAKLGDIDGHVTGKNVARGASPSLARPLWLWVVDIEC